MELAENDDLRHFAPRARPNAANCDTLQLVVGGLPFSRNFSTLSPELKVRPRFRMGEDFIDLSKLDDVALLELARRGHDGAFLTLYRRRQAKVYKFSMHMSGSASIADDVTQEVFLALMRQPGRYDPERGSLEAFLYGVARNHVLRRLGADRRYVPISDDQGESRESLDQPYQDDPHTEMARAETVESVRRAILSLPEHYREVVVLCDLHEMSYAEASAALGCAVGTVRSRLHRARKMLIEKLRPAAEQEDEPDGVKSARCVV